MPQVTQPASLPLYLDHPASTRPAEEVIDAMLPWLRESHANPHADNIHGQRAAVAVEEARAQIAECIGADTSEIVFTSGATEANNLALRGVWPSSSIRGRLAISHIEHKSLLETANDLASAGLTLIELPADHRGNIQSLVLREHVGSAKDPLWVTCAHANNELGVVQDVAAIGRIVREQGGHLHVDAAQSLGKLAVSVIEWDVDLVSLSSHKIYGPAGIGALFVSTSLRGRMRPQITGGGQEGGLRSGTVPAFLAVGFGKAVELANSRRSKDAHHLEAVVHAFTAELKAMGVAHETLSPSAAGLPGLVSLQLTGIDAADLLDRLAPQISASTGSACSAGELRASHVLRSIGMEEAQAREVMRLGFGRDNTPAQAQWVAQQIAQRVKHIHAIA